MTEFSGVWAYTPLLVNARILLVKRIATAVGAAKSLITIRSWWSSGLEMTAVGALEGAVTYIIGVGIGHIAG